MMTHVEYTELRIPAWALSYLVNGDDSGISAEDKATVDAYMQQYIDEAQAVSGTVIVVPGPSEPSFTWHPEFGLACDCDDSTIVILK